MIRKLRIKFVVTTMLVLLLVFASVFVTLNVFMRASADRVTEDLLDRIIGQDGVFWPPSGGGPPRGADFGGSAQPTLDMLRVGRFFYVKLDGGGSVIEMRHDMMFDFSDEEAEDYARLALARGKEKGSIENYRYAAADKPYGKIVVFAERSFEMMMLSQLINISLWSAGGTCVAIFLFSLTLSRWAVGPVEAAFNKQRRFISDASHELKTPLTILCMNAELLQTELGDNAGLNGIKTQAERMRKLIGDLLTLAKTDEGAGIVFSEFDLSAAVLGVALEFESCAYEEGKTYCIDIRPDIAYSGDADGIKRLASVLIDNAISHSDIHGSIGVSLSKNTNGRPLFSVKNTGAGIAESERQSVFDRFYRSDSSRARETGGYGLGLAIAKSIAENHKGEISIDGQTGKWVRFSVRL